MKNDKIIHLPGLNGLRAIAAIVVIISHTTFALGSFGLDPAVFGKSADGKPTGLLLAGFGVTIFFSLSGFLITFLLLKEKEMAQVNVKKFYIRRALRIWPLYYLYLAVALFVTSRYRFPHVHSSAIIYYVFLSANIPYILGQALPFLRHYWSLGVEEQFYIFWPWIARTDNKKLLRIIIIACITLITVKIAAGLVHIHLGTVNLYDILHVTRFHCMMIGAIGAVLYYNSNRLFIKLTTNVAVQAASWIVILLIAVNRFRVTAILDDELVSCVSVCLIMGQACGGKSRIINLNNKLCNFLGKISYGLYVTHPLILFFAPVLLTRFKPAPVVNYVVVYGVVLTASIIIAYLSYTFYEKRFLKLKSGFAVVKSSDTGNEDSDAGYKVQPSYETAVNTLAATKIL